MIQYKKSAKTEDIIEDLRRLEDRDAVHEALSEYMTLKQARQVVKQLTGKTFQDLDLILDDVMEAL